MLRNSDIKIVEECGVKPFTVDLIGVIQFQAHVSYVVGTEDSSVIAQQTIMDILRSRFYGELDGCIEELHKINDGLIFNDLRHISSKLEDVIKIINLLRFGQGDKSSLIIQK